MPENMEVHQVEAALSELTSIDTEGLDETLLDTLRRGRLRPDGFMRIEFVETIAKHAKEHANGEAQLILLEMVCFFSQVHHEHVERYHLIDDDLERTKSEAVAMARRPAFERTEEMLRKFYNSPRDLKAEISLDSDVTRDYNSAPQGRLVKVQNAAGAKHGLAYVYD